MCGIAGLMMRDGSAPDRALLDRMIGAIAHRGPDGDGLHIARGVGLAQVRLAIIDRSTNPAARSLSPMERSTITSS